MGLVVRPERNWESAGIPAGYRPQMSRCTSATAIKTEQTTWTAHPAWSAWSEESAAVIGISATIVSSGLPTLRCARAKSSASPAPTTETGPPESIRMWRWRPVVDRHGWGLRCGVDRCRLRSRLHAGFGGDSRKHDGHLYPVHAFPGHARRSDAAAGARGRVGRSDQEASHQSSSTGSSVSTVSPTDPETKTPTGLTT